MTKQLSVLLLATALILAACGSQPATATQPEPAPVETEAPVVETSAPEVATLEPTTAPTETPTVTPTEETAAVMVSFANDVMPILESRCINCHGGERIEEGLIMTSYTNLMTGSMNGAVVVPGDVNNSLFIQMILDNKMPKRGPKLTPAQLQILIDWVTQGALDN